MSYVLEHREIESGAAVHHDVFVVDGSCVGMWWVVPKIGDPRYWTFNFLFKNKEHLSGVGASLSGDGDLYDRASEMARYVYISAIYGRDPRGVMNTCRYCDLHSVLWPLFPRYAFASWPDVGNPLRAILKPDAMRFRDSLDGEAVRLVERFLSGGDAKAAWAVMKPRIWAGLDETFVRGAPLRAMIERFPFHAHDLAELWGVDPSVFAEDAQSVMLKSLSRVVGSTISLRRVPHSTFERCVASIEAAAARVDPDSRVIVEARLQSREAALVLMLALPLDWIPKTDDEWDALLQLSTPMVMSLMAIGSGTPPDGFLNVKGRWRETANRLRKLTGIASDADISLFLCEALGDVIDMVDAFDAQVVSAARFRLRYPVANAATAVPAVYPAARTLLFGNKSLTQVLATSANWHARQFAIADALGRLSPQGADGAMWLPGLPDWRVGAIEIRVLTSRRQLIEEGRPAFNADGSRGLQHCVGGYQNICREGRARILSLRVADSHPPRRLSTAHLQINASFLAQGIKTLPVVQHKSHKNSHPSEDCEQALSLYLREIESGRLKIDIHGLKPSKSSTPSRLVADRIGYDPTDAKDWQEVFEQWSRYLPRPVRLWKSKDFAAFSNADVDLRTRLDALRKPTFVASPKKRASRAESGRAREDRVEVDRVSIVEGSSLPSHSTKIDDASRRSKTRTGRNSSATKTKWIDMSKISVARTKASQNRPRDAGYI